MEIKRAYVFILWYGDMVDKILYYQYNFITYSLHITLRLKLFSTHSWSLTTKINYSCGFDNNILEKVKKITNMVYKIVEIKYT